MRLFGLICVLLISTSTMASAYYSAYEFGPLFSTNSSDIISALTESLVYTRDVLIPLAFVRSSSRYDQEALELCQDAVRDLKAKKIELTRLVSHLEGIAQDPSSASYIDIVWMNLDTRSPTLAQIAIAATGYAAIYDDKTREVAACIRDVNATISRLKRMIANEAKRQGAAALLNRTSGGGASSANLNALDRMR
jgi:hypothetical protein